MQIYVSSELEDTYGAAIHHLSGHLKNYAAVGIVSDQDVEDIRAMIDAPTKKTQHAMLSKLVERMFPEEGKSLLASPQNLAAFEAIFKTLNNGAWRGSLGQSENARLNLNGKPIDVGFVYVPKELFATPQRLIKQQMEGGLLEDRDPDFKSSQLKDTAIFILTHEIGHLVRAQKAGDFHYNTMKGFSIHNMNHVEMNGDEQYSDDFAVQNAAQMASLGIVSNPDIGVEFMQSRIILGVYDMFAKLKPDAKVNIDHMTGLIHDPSQLNAAAASINKLWQDSKLERRNPQHMYKFMQDLRQRDDVSEDVRGIANSFIYAIDYMMEGRQKPLDRQSRIDAPSSKANEPIIIHDVSDTKMMVGKEPMAGFFDKQAVGQASSQSIELGNDGPRTQLARKADNSLTPT